MVPTHFRHRSPTREPAENDAGGPVPATRRSHTRRGVLAAAAATGALAAVPVGVQLPTAAEATPDKRSLTYRETGHIREAYRRMRF